MTVMLFNPFLIPIVAIVAYFVYCLVDSISKHAAAASKHRADAELKMTLAQQGMSADEILRIVNGQPTENPWSGSRSAASTGPVAPRKQPTVV